MAALLGWFMRNWLLVPVLSSVLVLTGCQALVFRADDSPGDRALKVGSRATLGHATFGISEIFVFFARDGLVPEDETRSLQSKLTRLERDQQRAEAALEDARSEDEQARLRSYQRRLSRDLERTRHHLARTYQILHREPIATPPVRHRDAPPVVPAL